MWLKRYSMTSYFLEMMHSRAKIDRINKEIETFLVAESGSTSHMMNSLKNMKTYEN